MGLGTLNRGKKRMTKGRTPRHRYRKVGVRWSGLSAPDARHVCYLKLNREVAVYDIQLNKRRRG